MIYVPEIHFSKLAVGTLNQFLFDGCEIVTKNNPPKGKGFVDIEAKRKDVENINTPMGKLLGRNSKSDYAKEIITTDKLRDNDIIGIKGICKYFMMNPNPDIANGARILYNRIDQHGNIAGMEYNKQTAIVKSIIKDCAEQDNLKNAVTAVPGASDWMKAMKTDNENFEKTYANRNTETAQKPEEAASEMRPSAEEAWRELTEEINAFVRVSKDDTYDPMVRELTVLIDKYKDIIAHHTTGKKSGANTATN